MIMILNEKLNEKYIKTTTVGCQNRMEANQIQMEFGKYSLNEDVEMKMKWESYHPYLVKVFDFNIRY